MRLEIPLLRYFVLLVASLIGFSTMKGEAFHIKKFKSTIVVNRDGSLTITETIDVNFTEKKRGILRVIPYRYTTQSGGQGEIAEGHRSGFDYITPIKEINVKNWPFSTQEGYNDLTLKIGSSDKYIDGDQRYEIEYRVYGVINQFKSSQELYLNITGNDWDVEIDTVVAEFILPDRKQFSKADIHTYSGVFGLSFGNETVLSKPGNILVTRTKKLFPKEGLTVAIKMPTKYIPSTEVPLEIRAKDFVIDSVFSDLKLRKDGAINVKEVLWLNCLQSDVTFIRNLYGDFIGQAPREWVSFKQEFEPLQCKIFDLENGTNEPFAADLYDPRDAYSPAKMEIPQRFFRKGVRYKLELNYVIWNAVSKFGDDSGLYISWLSGIGSEPIAKARLHLHWENDVAPNLSNIKFGIDAPGDGKLTLEKNDLFVKIPNPIKPTQRVNFFLKFPNTNIPVSPAPLRLLSPSSYINAMHVIFDIHDDGMVRIDNRLSVVKSNWATSYVCPITAMNSPWTDYGYLIPKPQKWGNEGYFLISNWDIGNGQVGDRFADFDKQIEFPSPPNFVPMEPSELNYAYSIYGIIQDSKEVNQEGKHFIFPLVDKFIDPIERITFSIRLPKKWQFDRNSLRFQIAETYQKGPMIQPDSLQIENNEIIGVFKRGKVGGNQIVVEFDLPEDAIHTSLWLELQLVWKNHKLIFFPILLLPILVLTWFIWGRDKRFPLVVEYYPPLELTPTEAGLLIDDKLHNRDILALIYYWGAQGIIDISEIKDESGGVSDYLLTKLKAIPQNARKYEKTFFGALFGVNETSVKISSKSGSFFMTMEKVRMEVEDHSKTMKFYVPGTRSFATWMRNIGFILIVIAIIAAGFEMFAYSEAWVIRSEIAFSFGLMGIMLFLFAKIMPKHAPFGQQQFAKLAGFEEFLLRAEKDKLEELVNTNPDYFGMTLPYAIALGIATQWVSKFEGLTIMAPRYYSTGKNNSAFEMDSFNRIMQRQLNSMSNSFNKRPASSGSYSGSSSSRSYSSYSSSSSSRSYSSSGSSGRSSFSSRGSSGGGYGGGGGSSW